MTISTTPTGALAAPLGQGAYRQPFLHDTWAPLSHIIGVGIGADLLAPGIGLWLCREDRRRLLAYQVLQAYMDNVRRHWLPRYMWAPGEPSAENPTAAFPQALQYREYGTAKTLVDQVRSLVLGDEQKPVVEAAEPVKNTSGEAIAPDPNGLPVKAKAFLEDWFDAEKVKAKLVENETRTAGLGDGVLVLTWDEDVERPRLRAYDPGFYFPDWRAIHSKEYVEAGWRDEDYPPVVHLAWEWADDDGNVWIRRTTWRMTRLKKPTPRPWGGRPATWTCMFDVADYDIARTNGEELADFPKRAIRQQVVPATDLQIDFIPVVHVPNDWPGSDLWGRSTLLHASQVLDDMASADTDLALNSQVVASPKIITKNATKAPEAGPGDWMNLFGTDSDLSILDTSKTLDALLKHRDHLRQIVATTTRLGNLFLGMVSSSGRSSAESASGYSMRLGFATAEALEREMTQVRHDKYGLLLKMVLRFGQANGLIPGGETPKVEMVLGRGLPADRAASVVDVQNLLGVNAISTLTGVKMLMEAGVPIEDAVVEVARIQSEKVEVAIGLVEATGDVQAARKYLGLKGEGPPPPPQPAGGPGGTPVPAPEPPRPDQGTNPAPPPGGNLPAPPRPGAPPPGSPGAGGPGGAPRGG